MHPVQQIYKASGVSPIYGDTLGICRITGEKSAGVPFNKWVRDTFTDYANLCAGDIISNEALFCFDEASELIRQKTGKEKPQRFRTYSHIIDANGTWHCFTKSDKKTIFNLIIENATLVCLTDSGQKHLLFKHKPGMWQLDDIFIIPDIILLDKLHKVMMQMLELGFSQAEIITGNYLQYRIMQCGLKVWKENEDYLHNYRGSKFFSFTAWLLYNDKLN